MPVGNDIAGERFGRLVAVNQDDKRARYWVFRCDCGTVKSIRRWSVKTGESKSCGCLMRDAADITGKRFGRLVAVNRDDRRSHNSAYHWVFRCDCGTVKSILRGSAKSCGCLTREFARELGWRNKTHGLRHSREYESWAAMRSRCKNKNNACYEDYGGRGISIAQRWNDFQAFIDDMGPRPLGHSLDRKNNEGDYGPDNCRWANAETQANNKRNNRIITFQGETMTLPNWARRVGLEVPTIRRRLDFGWSTMEALTLAKGSRKPKAEKQPKHLEFNCIASGK